jgi:hypothetical protein
MSSVVFILGAGASKQAGAPLMGNFLDVAGDLLLSGKVQENDKRDDFDRVFKAIGGMQAVHSKARLDHTNIESVFTALELGRIIQTFPGLDLEGIELAIASLKQLIVKTLEITIPFPVSKHGRIEAPKPYSDFCNLLNRLRVQAAPNHSVSVITFNYDLCIDMAMYRADLGPDYALEPAVGVGFPVQLMKLHGSLNWVKNDIDHTIAALEMQRLEREMHSAYATQLAFPEIREFRIPFSSLIQYYFQDVAKIAVSPERVIVPPSWNKSDYHKTLSQVWARAARHLSEAKYIFVIGYSLPETDSFFRHLYALGSVGAEPLRKFVVCDPAPEASGVNARFRTLLGTGAISRYEYHQVEFKDAISRIGDMFKGA